MRSLLWFSTPWFEVPPTPAFLGVGPIDFWLPLALFPVPEVFVAGLCSCLSSVFPLSLDSSPVLLHNSINYSGITLQGTFSPTPPINGNAKKCGANIIVVRTSRGTFARFPHRHIRVIMPAVADDWCWGAESDGERQSPETVDGRCSTQGAAEY